MPAYVGLTLDTTAPNVTWGAQTGTTAGELLQLAYVSDEPIDSATLMVAGGPLNLTVGATILSVQLPVDTPDGWTAVVVTDDVGNARSYPAVVLIHSTIVVVPAPDARPRGAPSRRAQPQRSRVIRRHVTIATACSSRVRARRTRRIALPVWSASTQTSHRTAGALNVARATFTSRASLTERSQASVDHELAVRRRDGPDLEDLLLLL